MSESRTATMDEFLDMIRSQAEKFQCLIVIFNDQTCASYVAEGRNTLDDGPMLLQMMNQAQQDVMRSLTLPASMQAVIDEPTQIVTLGFDPEDMQ